MLRYGHLTKHEANEVDREDDLFVPLDAFYRSDIVTAQKVVDALARAKVPLKDLRIWQSDKQDTFRNVLSWPSLSTLRIAAPPSIFTDSDNESTLQCARMLAKLPNLQDIYISTTEWVPNNICDIFDALADHKRLRRVELTTGWRVSKKDLVKFVGVHAHSIRYLIFDDLILMGS